MYITRHIPRGLYNARRHVFGAGRFSVLVLLIGWIIPTGQILAAGNTGEKVFQTNCTPCHTIGGGKLVGPDLAGVTSRRENDWLRRQIKEPDQLIAEKDPIATKLLDKYKVPMAPLGLSDTQVTAVIDYLKSTEQKSTVEAGLPARYLPTLSLSAAVLVVLTVVGLRAGRKSVDVR